MKSQEGIEHCSSAILFFQAGKENESPTKTYKPTHLINYNYNRLIILGKESHTWKNGLSKSLPAKEMTIQRHCSRWWTLGFSAGFTLWSTLRSFSHKPTTEKAMTEVLSLWARKKNIGPTKNKLILERREGRRKKPGMYMHFEYQSTERQTGREHHFYNIQ